LLDESQNIRKPAGESQPECVAVLRVKSHPARHWSVLPCHGYELT
jgi:hypothetical protein